MSKQTLVEMRLGTNVCYKMRWWYANCGKNEVHHGGYWRYLRPPIQRMRALGQVYAQKLMS